MKKTLTFLLIGFLFFSLMSCEENKKPHADKELLKAQRHERTINWIKKEMRYPAVLLAAKYKVDDNKVFDFLVDRETLLYEGKYYIVDMKTITDYSKNIR